MKRILRSFAIHLFAVWVIATAVGGIFYNDNFVTLALGAAALTAVDILIKPLINLLLLPFNLITLGTFRWISNVVTLYLATLLVPDFSISAFTYPGFSSSLFIIPETHLSVFWAYIAISFGISIISSFLFWLVH